MGEPPAGCSLADARAALAAAAPALAKALVWAVKSAAERWICGESAKAFEQGLDVVCGATAYMLVRLPAAAEGLQAVWPAAAAHAMRFAVAAVAPATQGPATLLEGLQKVDAALAAAAAAGRGGSGSDAATAAGGDEALAAAEEAMESLWMVRASDS